VNSLAEASLMLHGQTALEQHISCLQENGAKLKCW
jgi:hypothetical protein